MTWVAGGGGGGGKGGGGGSGTPTEAKDTLESKAYAKIIDLLGEGEIEGFPSARTYSPGSTEYNNALLKDIYLNNTPILRTGASVSSPQDSDFNFKNVQVHTRLGTQAQPYIPGFASVEEETAVGSKVEQATPITRTISNANTDAVRVTITVPQLQRFEDDGDIVGASVQLQIQLSYNGGGYTTVVSDTITGRTGDLYQRDYLINLASTRPVDVRVVRVTPDSTSSKLADAFNWASYTQITYTKLRYPNSALVAFRVDAEQFSSIPSRSFRVRGLKVRIPSNATVDSLTGRLIYSGVWDGTFQAARWASCPAWCLYDLLLSDRYGFGDHIKQAQLDKWAFYAASQYANGLVPNGFGSFEPRFSMNCNIQTREEAYKLINDLCSVFRVMPFWSTGSMTIAQDRPADPVYLFNEANVTEDGFNYIGSSLKQRSTVAVVSYLDLSTREIAYEVVEDYVGIAKYGVVTKEVSGFACTSRGQAARLGEWILYSEQFETETVTFSASVDAGVVVRPGQVIEIADPGRAGQRRGGRILSATTTAVTVDSAAEVPQVGGATLSVLLRDGSVQSRPVVGYSGNVITVSPAFETAPQAGAVWIHQSNDLKTTQWRVLAVEEREGTEYQITALTYNSSKYDYVERDRPLQFRDTTSLNDPLPTPTGLAGAEVLYANNGRVLSKIKLSWRTVVGAKQYQIRYRLAQGNWIIDTSTAADYEILDTKPGAYQIEVASLNAALKPSAPATLTFTAQGTFGVPADVTGVSLIPIDQTTALVSWNPAPDLDVQIGGKVLIHHEPKLTGASWQTSNSIVPSASGNQTQKQVPLLEGTYLLKFEDQSGARSVNAATIRADLPTPQPRLLVEAIEEDQITPTPFTGTKVDMSYSSTNDALILNSDGSGNVLPTGTYTFANTLDLDGVFDVNLRKRLATRPLVVGSLWDSDTRLIDEWEDIDGIAYDATNCLLYVRSTNDNPASSPVWGPWREFSNAMCRGRGFQFYAKATSNNVLVNILVDELGATVELQQRVEQSGILNSGAGTYSVTFAEAFYEAPSVGVTGFNMDTGDYFAITSVTRTGFSVVFRDSAAAAVDRQFTYTAIGYGREIV